MDKESSNNHFIKLNKLWFSKDINNRLLIQYGYIGLSIMCIINRSLTVRGYYKFSVQEILDSLYIKNTNSRLINSIKNTLLQMNSGNSIQLFTDTKFNNRINPQSRHLNNTQLIYATHSIDKFFIVYDYEIDEIIQYVSNNKHVSTFSLIAYFCLLCSMFGNNPKLDNYKICYPTFGHISSMTNISSNTISKYNSILRNLELVFFDNTNIAIDSITNLNNVYSRFSDEKHVFEAINRRSKATELKRHTKLDIELKNRQRSIKMKITKFKNKFDCVDDLNDKQYEYLQKLELDYFNLLKQRGKKPKKGIKFWTIKMDGTTKSENN